MPIIWLTLLLAADAEPARLEWTVAGKQREALIFRPGEKPTADSALAATGAPVVFGFHGHGGTAQHAARTFRLQQLWPEAIVVYMQGIPTPGRLTDPEGKRTGWQHDAGDHDDRDLKFFDAVLTTLRTDYDIDENRVYATGHSNGAAFTYVLWAARGDLLAAVAPSAGSSRSIRSLKPKPAMHIAGRNDDLVRFPLQERTMQAVRVINGCEGAGKEWAKDCMLYASSKNAPFVAMIHDGGHKYPAEAPPLIVKFFQQHSGRAKDSK